jgi:hypothetical protein
MEHRALASLMIRMVGLWELIVAMNAIPGAIAPFFNPEYIAKAGFGMLVASGLFSVGIPLLLGLALIYFPSTATTKVLRIASPAADESRDTPLLERVAIAALGLWLAVQAVLEGVHTFSRWHLYRRFVEDQYPGATGPAIGPQEFAGLITALLQLAIGLWLLLGSRGLANALARLRG